MTRLNGYWLRKKDREELSTGARLYGKSMKPESIEREYEYDNGGRLSKVICDNAVVEHYQYGKNGERLFAETRQIRPRLFKYGQSMQLLQAGEVKYMYDNQGRMIMKNDLGQVTRYSYLESGPLHEVRLPDGRRIEYTSDPLGRRIAKSINDKVVEKYLWQDLTTLIAVTDGEGLHPKVFSYNEEGDPTSMTYEGRTFIFATNQLGSIFMVADERGNEVKRIIYDSFGNLLFDSGASLDVCLGFAAGLLDKDTGLIHFGYREYDPAIGRFITPDPLGLAGGDVDVYGYCLDDPINFYDRTGLAGESEESKEKSAESTKFAGANKVNRPSEKAKNKKTKYAGTEKHGEPSRYEKKAGVDNSSSAPAKNKPRLTLQELGDAAWDGAKKGAIPGMIYGSALGPLGSAAGLVTGVTTGASIGMLYEVGSIAISDTLGIDKDTQKRLREEMGKVNSKNKRRKNQ